VEGYGVKVSNAACHIGFGEILPLTGKAAFFAARLRFF
jgi:hypothetical protein